MSRADIHPTPPSELPEGWRLEGRRALVTGGTRGIGRAIVEQLLGFGCRVFLVARNQSELDERVGEWQARGYPVDGFAADLGREADRRRLVDWLAGQVEALEILVNNAGSNLRKPFLDYRLEEYEALMRLNLTAAFRLCQLTFPLLKNAGSASVVNIASVAGLTHLPTGAPYAISKAGLIQLTRNLAVEWAEHGIRVNCIAPWYIRTPLTEGVLSQPEYRSRVLARTPLGRIGRPEEVAGLAVFLCLPIAGYISGQTIAVDGGFLCKGM
ncbi:MAG: SDR family oxidoreductase [Calditrichaeota bacterium]|nr:MAG: SDR family oxidoreductase [Calditrichota bacterium]